MDRKYIDTIKNIIKTIDKEIKDVKTDYPPTTNAEDISNAGYVCGLIRAIEILQKEISEK